MKSIEELGISQAPWRVVEIGRPIAVVANDDNFVCEVNFVRERQNASLIAAAPELYDALQRIVAATEDSVMDYQGWQDDLHNALDDAKMALAKAAGEEVA